MVQSPAKLSKPVIGLVGSIGAGKSTVAGLLRDCGAAVIDSDRLGHEELNVPEVVQTLREWWGDQVVDASGGVIRRAVAEVVFKDPKALASLEGLLYPRIAARRDECFARLDADPQVVAIVLDAPKLYEAKLETLCDAVIFVDADRTVRLRRLADSRGWDAAELDRRENQQIPLDRKQAKADYSVTNNHARIDGLRSSIQETLALILASYRSSHRGDASGV